MTTNTIILIVVVAIAAILLIAAIAWVGRNKRIQHRRVEAGEIREKATDQAHQVGQREALADETAAKARAAQAEADAKAAHATGLEHQAQIRRSDAATARDEVNQEFERADKIDPDSQTVDDEPRQGPNSHERQSPNSHEGANTHEMPRRTSGVKDGPTTSMPRVG